MSAPDLERAALDEGRERLLADAVALLRKGQAIIAILKEQRDELLGLLSECLVHVGGWDLDLGPRVLAAIAKAEDGK